MVQTPAATAVAMPLLVTVATAGFDEPQVTCVVKSKLAPPEKVPVAVNCWMTPTGMVGLAGITDREDKVEGVTPLMVAVPEILSRLAVTIAVPAATAVARPLLLIMATEWFDELQVTCVVISWLLPSEYVPVAVNCWAIATCMVALAGVTDMGVGVKVAEVTARLVLPEMVVPGILGVAVMVALPGPTAVARPLPSTDATDMFDELQATSGVIS